jgi:cytochrome c-type biogenesis protein CcmH/NrfG
MAEAPPAAVAGAAHAEAARLEARKRDLYAAIRALARDHEEGTVDEAAFHAARERYETEAANILERLDTITGTEARVDGVRPHSRSWPILVLAIAGIIAAVVLFLVTAIHDRGGGTITGSQPGAAPTSVPSALSAALTQAQHNPRRAVAWLNLGNVYLDTGSPAAADRAFRTAIRLAPGRPDAPTLDALALAAENELTPALQVLSGVERAHPTYAQAWLTDGLIAARRAPGIPRAIRAWKRFLVLQPHGPVSAEVRASLRTLERAERAGR